MNEESEFEKCKNSPYYFYTTYMTVTDREGNTLRATTRLTEEEFNECFNNTRNYYKSKWEELHNRVKKTGNTLPSTLKNKSNKK